MTAVVQSRFSDDVTAELPGYITAADPDTVVLHRDAAPLAGLTNDGRAQLVILMQPLPGSPAAAAARMAKGPDTDAAVQVAAQLALADGIDLILTPAGKASSSRVSDLIRRGVQATAGDEPTGSLVVAPTDSTANGIVHIAVVSGSNEASDDMDQWVEALDGHKQRESRQQ